MTLFGTKQIREINVGIYGMREDKIPFEMYVCAVIVIMTSVLGVFLFVISDRFREKEISYDLSEGWLYEDGSEVSFEQLDLSRGHFSIYRSIDAQEQQQNSLCMKTQDLYFTVYCDDKMVYDFHRDVPKIFGKSSGVNFHQLTLPEYGETALLRMEIDLIYKDSGYIQEMSFMNSGDFARTHLRAGMPYMILCVVDYFYGIVLLGLGLHVNSFKERRSEMAAIGGFAMVSALWTVTKTGVFQILSVRPDFIHFLDCFVRMLFAFPGVIYIAWVTGNDHSKSKKVATIAMIVNFFVTILFNLLGIRDFHEMQFTTYIVLMIDIVVILYMIIRGFYRKTTDRKVYLFWAAGFVLTVSSGTVDLIRHNLGGRRYVAGSSVQIGLFFFIIVTGCYELAKVIELSRKGRQAEFMERLAYHDGLTGLYNRQAFLREEKNLAEKKEGEYTIIQFDVNNLKLMNDTYGHCEGDRYIIGAANVLRESFGESHCFRTGGDEFIAIVPGNSEDDVFRKERELLEEKIREFNRREQMPIPMSIAYGYATYNAETMDPETVEQVADQRMYEMKNKMKEAM